MEEVFQRQVTVESNCVVDLSDENKVLATYSIIHGGNHYNLLIIPQLEFDSLRRD